MLLFCVSTDLRKLSLQFLTKTSSSCFMNPQLRFSPDTRSSHMIICDFRRKTNKGRSMLSASLLCSKSPILLLLCWVKETLHCVAAVTLQATTAALPLVFSLLAAFSAMLFMSCKSNTISSVTFPVTGYLGYFCKKQTGLTGIVNIKPFTIPDSNRSGAVK